MVGLTQGAFGYVGLKPGQRGRSATYMSNQVLLGKGDVLTLFAPQPDRRDASRVVVSYELNGVAGELLGIVTDRGYVDFSTASGPAVMSRP
jgi:hypothetical protein